MTTEQAGVITGFFKSLNAADADKNKVMKAFFLYILERKPEPKEFAMLQKLIKDFGYEILFDALVALRYSNIELTNYYGYLVSICKNLLKDSIKENTDDQLTKRTEDMLSELRQRMKKS